MGWVSAAVQVARDLISPPRVVTLELEPSHVFNSTPRPVDQVIAAMRSGERVSRTTALSVAAVQRGRNEICSISTLPLKLYRGLNVVDAPLFRQFDVDVPNVVHLAQTLEDLAFESIAWWKVTGRGFDGYPASVRRIDPAAVSLHDPKGRAQTARQSPGGIDPTGDGVWIDYGDGRGHVYTPARDVIRFDSPNPGILRANARAIRIALRLDSLTEMYASNPALREFFTDADDATDVMQDEDIDAFLAEYGAMRQVRPYGWIPSNVKRADVTAPSPRDLTLVDLTQQTMLAIANGLGVDPEDLGVSTTSRTYFNSVDKKQDKINRVYAPFMRAITDRLSMGDVTPRGYAAGFDLTDYLKSDPVTQATYWEALQRMGVTDRAEIRGWAGLTGPPPAAETPAAPPAAADQSSRLRVVSAASGPAFTFGATEFAETPPAPTVDTAARTITGLAVPYNAVANKYGMRYSFRPGSLEYSAPDRMAHLKDHQTPVGYHRSIEDTPEGPVVTLHVLDAPEGTAAKEERDLLLYDAAHGLYSGLSVGVDFDLDPDAGDVEYNAATGVWEVVRATWRETSTTYMPAFDDARVTKVAASRSGGSMKCQHCGQEHATNIACATFAAHIAPAPPAVAAAPPGTPAPAGPSVQEFLAGLAAAAGQPATAGPTVVSASRTAVAEVTEPAPYVFDRRGNLRPGSHDFSSDLFAGWKNGDQAARDRAQQFVQEQFAVTPANVATLNPSRQRPDLYVDQMEYAYPVYDAINAGTLTDITPFVVPKFATATGLVADHVTGTEPTPGAFSATSQTITPTPVSGKVEVTREAFDQGGNPQMSGLIWRQMTRAYYEALEAYAIAQLVVNTASIADITITTGATNGALDAAIASALVPLKYIRGGDRFRRVFTQVDLYRAMVGATDTTGRRLYPAYGPTNAAGTAEPSYDYLEAHGKLWVPAWATAATSANSAMSYMLNSDGVHLWASAPQRIDLEWRVAWVDIGIWGYKAFAITDTNAVREIAYDPAV